MAVPTGFFGAGLWLNIPDYDAPTQMVKPHERNTRYVDAVLTIPKVPRLPLTPLIPIMHATRESPQVRHNGPCRHYTTCLPKQSAQQKLQQANPLSGVFKTPLDVACRGHCTPCAA